MLCRLNGPKQKSGHAPNSKLANWLKAVRFIVFSLNQQTQQAYR